jgi:hypothetical protein
MEQILARNPLCVVVRIMIIFLSNVLFLLSAPLFGGIYLACGGDGAAKNLLHFCSTFGKNAYFLL